MKSLNVGGCAPGPRFRRAAARRRRGGRVLALGPRASPWSVLPTVRSTHRPGRVAPQAWTKRAAIAGEGSSRSRACRAGCRALFDPLGLLPCTADAKGRITCAAPGTRCPRRWQGASRRGGCAPSTWRSSRLAAPRSSRCTPAACIWNTHNPAAGTTPSKMLARPDARRDQPSHVARRTRVRCSAACPISGQAGRA